MDNSISRGRSRHDTIMAQCAAIQAGDAAALADFVRLALADPVAAADALAWFFDCTVTHHEGSDDCRALEDWASSLDVDDLSHVAWRAARSHGPASIRAAMSAVVAGGLAMMDDLRDAA